MAKIETVVQKFLELRDLRSEKKKAWEKEDSDLKAKQNRLEIWFLNKIQELGVDSITTEFGTAYTTTETKGSCNDWQAFWEWLVKYGRMDLLEKRISIKGIKEYLDETGALPPAVNINKERVVRIRRS